MGMFKHCNSLQHTTAHLSTLQHTATHCNTLQHTATHATYLEQQLQTDPMSNGVCNTLQHTVAYRNTLQHTEHTTTHCSTPAATIEERLRLVQWRADTLLQALGAILNSQLVASCTIHCHVKCVLQCVLRCRMCVAVCVSARLLNAPCIAMQRVCWVCVAV